MTAVVTCVNVQVMSDANRKLKRFNILLTDEEASFVEDVWHEERRKSFSGTLRVIVREGLVRRGKRLSDTDPQ